MLFYKKSKTDKKSFFIYFYLNLLVFCCSFFSYFPITFSRIFIASFFKYKHTYNRTLFFFRNVIHKITKPFIVMRHALLSWFWRFFPYEYVCKHVNKVRSYENLGKLERCAVVGGGVPLLFPMLRHNSLPSLSYLCERTEMCIVLVCCNSCYRMPCQ